MTVVSANDDGKKPGFREEVPVFAADIATSTGSDSSFGSEASDSVDAGNGVNMSPAKFRSPSLRLSQNVYYNSQIVALVPVARAAPGVCLANLKPQADCLCSGRLSASGAGSTQAGTGRPMAAARSSCRCGPSRPLQVTTSLSTLTCLVILFKLPEPDSEGLPEPA